MAVIEDIYRLTTQSDTSELRAAQQVLGAQIGNLKGRLATMAQTAAHTARELGRLRPTASGAAMALSNMARGAGVAMRGMGGLFNLAARGVGILGRIGGIALGAVGGIADLGVAAFNSLGGMEAMNEAMDGIASDGAGVGATTETAAEGMNAMGDAAQSTETKVSGLMGAFGDVGAGFIQRQGRAAETVTNQGKQVTESLKNVDKALTGTEAKLGSFGEETSRLGKAWENIKNIFLRAIGTAILPLINALATALEDPRFIKFVTLLADDLAAAISVIVNWLVTQAIPAVLSFLEQVNAAGGPVEFFKQKWEELKTTFLQVIAILIGGLLEASNTSQAIFQGIGDVAEALWNRITTTFMQLVAIVLAGLIQMQTFFTTIFTAIGNFVTLKWNELVFKAVLMFMSLRSKVDGFRVYIVTAFQDIGNSIAGVWQGITDWISAKFSEIGAIAITLGEALIAPFKAVEAFVLGDDGVIERVRAAFNIGIQAIANGINQLIQGYNKIVNGFGIPGIGQVEVPSFAAGGIVSKPMPAIVGDAATPEVVSPLGDLLPMIGATVRSAMSGMENAGGALTIEQLQVNVTLSDGAQNPYQTGVDIARGMKSEMSRLRQSGIRIPAAAFG